MCVLFLRARPGRDRSGRPSLVDRRRVSDLFLVAPSSWIFFRVLVVGSTFWSRFSRAVASFHAHTHRTNVCSPRVLLCLPRRRLQGDEDPSTSSSLFMYRIASHRRRRRRRRRRARAPRGVCVWITGARIFARSRDIARGARRATRRWPRRGVGYMCMNIVFALDARAGRGGGVGGRGRRGFDRSMRMRGD